MTACFFFVYRTPVFKEQGKKLKTTRHNIILQTTALCGKKRHRAAVQNGPQFRIRFVCVYVCVQNPTPTRAEASDVATAIYDGADGIMLSAESAAGKFPLESVQMQQKIITSVENDPVQPNN